MFENLFAIIELSTRRTLIGGYYVSIRTRFTVSAKARAASMLIAGSLGFSSTASAAYPDRAIRLVVGFSAGGTTDVVARIVGKEIGDALGQPVEIGRAHV